MPDAEVLHEPEACNCCGRDLEGAKRVKDGEESRQVFDLPEEIVLGVVAHVAVDRFCGRCGQISTGSFPVGVDAPAQYGPGLRALGVYLHVFQHIPYDRARQLIFDMTGAEILTGTLKRWVDRAAAGLADFDGELLRHLKRSAVVHFDETGARIAGRLGWVHSASTETLTRYTSHARRGVLAMDAAGVLPGFTGVAVHDGWKPYRAYTDAIHALCAGHHLRELLAAQEAGQAWASGMSCLLLGGNDAVGEAKSAGLTALTETVLGELHASYRSVIALGYEENLGLAEGAARRIKRTKAQNLLLRLDEREDEALRFAHDFRVPFTNNLRSRTYAWSSSSRRSPAAGAPSRAPSAIYESAPISPRRASRASARSACSPSSPPATPGCPRPHRAEQFIRSGRDPSSRDEQARPPTTSTPASGAQSATARARHPRS